MSDLHYITVQTLSKICLSKKLTTYNSQLKMLLRPEIEPQLQVAEQLYPKILELVKEYDYFNHKLEAEVASKIIKKIADLANKDLSEDSLSENRNPNDLELLAFNFALPYPQKVENISKEETTEIVKRIQFISYDTFDNQVVTKDFKGNKYAVCAMLAQGYFMEFLDLNFSHPNVYRLFQSQKVNGKLVELSVDEIVKELFTQNSSPTF